MSLLNKTMTVSEFYTELNNLAIGKFSSVSNAKKLRYLNRAIMNLYDQIKTYSADYAKSTNITFSNGVANLPADCSRELYNFMLYSDESRTQIIGNANYRLYGSTLRFPDSNGSYYLEYSKTPSRYTTNDLSEELVEADDVRVLELLQTEVEYIRDTDIRQGQTSGQAQAARQRTNDII